MLFGTILTMHEEYRKQITSLFTVYQPLKFFFFPGGTDKEIRPVADQTVWEKTYDLFALLGTTCLGYVLLGVNQSEKKKKVQPSETTIFVNVTGRPPRLILKNRRFYRRFRHIIYV